MNSLRDPLERRRMMMVQYGEKPCWTCAVKSASANNTPLLRTQSQPNDQTSDQDDPCCCKNSTKEYFTPEMIIMRKYFEWKLSDLEKRMGEEMQNLLNENNDSDGVFADTINLSHSGRTPRVPGGNIRNGYSNLESPLPKKKKNVQVHESSIGVTGPELKGHDYSTLRRSNTGPYGVEVDIANGMTSTEIPIIRKGPDQDGNSTENKEKEFLHVLGKSGSGNTNEDTLLLDSSNYISKDLRFDYKVGLKTSPEFSGISAKNPHNNIKQQINIMASDLHKWKIHPTPAINRKTPDTDTTDLALQSPPPELEHTQQQQDRCIHKKFSFGPMAPNPSLSQDPKQFSPRPKSTTPSIDPKDLTP